LLSLEWYQSSILRCIGSKEKVIEENVTELPIASISMDSLEKEEKAEGEVIQKGQYKRAYQKNWITGNFKAN
jgi:hypothetical protein